MYQYIVIGGGAAGCPLAATLAKKGKTLLLERGNAKVEEPKSRTCIINEAVNWIQTESGSWAACANVLGGGSALNAFVFMKETRDGDFFKEHEFLQWDRVQKAYAEASKLSHERTSSTLFQDRMTNAMKEAGLGLKDIRTDTAHYGIYHPYSLFNSQGERCSAVGVLPSKEDPSFDNLVIKTNVLVTRILFDTTKSQPRAIGIEYRELSNGEASVQQFFEPEAEFYLSGGALRSPQLLMLSGIGDADELKKNNIDLVLHNRHVGLHLKDKPAVAVSVNSRLPIDHTVIDTMAMTKDFQIGTLSGGRIASGVAATTAALLPTKQRSPWKRKLLGFVLKYLPEPLLKRLNQQFTCFLVVNNPVSEGSVELLDSDARSQLRIFSPGLQDPEEIRAMSKGLLAIKKVIEASPLQAYRRDCAGPWSAWAMRWIGKLYASLSQYGDKSLKGTTPVTFPMLPDLEYLATEPHDANEENRPLLPGKDVERWLKGMYAEGWNYTSTCRFGDVVNHDFTVKGVDGLSIVDGSVLSRPPRVNGQATMMMLGFYAGDISRNSAS